MNNVTFDIGGTENVQATGGNKLEHVGETVTYTSPSLDTGDARALTIELIMRTVGTGSVTVTVERYDKSSKTWTLMLGGVAIVTNIASRYTISPDIAAVANVSAQMFLPEIYRVVVTHNNANATTYSLSGGLHN